MVGTTTQVARRFRVRVFVGRLALILIGFAVAWLMVEVFMRVGFDLLPAQIQGDIQHVQRVPWSEERIIQPIPFIIEKDFQTRLPPGLKDYPVHWSDARFTFSTISAWEGHRAGLRTDPPQWPLDILTLGDSFTFCWTKIEDCWVQRLHNDYHWNVVNAAIPATGTLGQFTLMKEVAPPLKPSLVVWTWYENDVTDDYDLAHLRGDTPELPSAPYPDAVREPVGLAKFSTVYLLIYNALYPAPKSTTYRHYQQLMINKRPLLVHTNEYTFPSNPSWPRAKYGWGRNVEAHEEGTKLAESLGAKMLLVVLPTKEEAYAEYLTDKLDQKYMDGVGETRRMLLDLCKQHSWNCIDALPAFKEVIKNGQTVYYGFDSHLDPSGNRVVAQLVHDYITDHNLLPSR